MTDNPPEKTVRFADQSYQVATENIPKRKATNEKRELRDERVSEIRDNLGTQAVVHTMYAIPSPAQVFYQTDLAEEAHMHLIKAKYNKDTPRSYKQAIAIDKENGNNLWKEAMDMEHAALKRSGTWKLVGL